MCCGLMRKWVSRFWLSMPLYVVFSFVARDYVLAGLIVLVVVLDSLRGIASSRVNEVSLAGARVPWLIVELSEMSISGLFC
jgi:hypothetical protein